MSANFVYRTHTTIRIEHFFLPSFFTIIFSLSLFHFISFYLSFSFSLILTLSILLAISLSFTPLSVIISLSVPLSFSCYFYLPLTLPFSLSLFGLVFFPHTHTLFLFFSDSFHLLNFVLTFVIAGSTSCQVQEVSNSHTKARVSVRVRVCVCVCGCVCGVLTQGYLDGGSLYSLLCDPPTCQFSCT